MKRDWLGTTSMAQTLAHLHDEEEELTWATAYLLIVSTSRTLPRTSSRQWSRCVCGTAWTA
jgi:hypothetical protein